MTEAFLNHYKVLGLKLGADTKRITKAYRKMALKVHPDRNKGNKAAADKFVKLTRSYEILTDDKKRKKFDDELKARMASKARNQKRSREIRTMRRDLQKRETEAKRQKKDPKVEARIKALQISNEKLRAEYQTELSKSSAAKASCVIRNKMGIVLVKWKRGMKKPSEARLKQRLKIFGTILDLRFLSDKRKVLVCFESAISAKAAASQKLGDLKISIPKSDVSSLFETPRNNHDGSTAVESARKNMHSSSLSIGQSVGVVRAREDRSVFECDMERHNAQKDASSPYACWLSNTAKMKLSAIEDSVFTAILARRNEVK